MSVGADGKGYIIPDNINPEGYRCFALYVPDDDGYVEALSGHLHDLTKWQSWAKDGTTRASQAASVWRDAIDKSIEELWLGAYIMTCENVEELLTAIQNMTVNVNVSVSGGGGGGCCETAKKWLLPDDWQNDLPITLPAPTGEIGTATSSELCDQAHQTHAKIREFLVDYDSLVAAASPFEELIAYMIALAVFMIPPAGILFSLLTIGSGVAYGFLERDSVAFWDDMKNDFVCAIVGHTNAQSFYGWLTDYVSANAPNFMVREWLSAILQMPDWTLIYDGVFNIENEYMNSDCNCVLGNWQSRNPQTALGVGSTVDVFSVDDSQFQASGYATPYSSTSWLLWIDLETYQTLPTEWVAVSFDVSRLTRTPDSDDSSKVPLLAYGADGNQVTIVEWSDSDIVPAHPLRVLLYHSGFSFNEDDFDIAISVSGTKLLPRFSLYTFTYQPSNCAFQININNWKSYE